MHNIRDISIDMYICLVAGSCQWPAQVFLTSMSFYLPPVTLASCLCLLLPPPSLHTRAKFNRHRFVEYIFFFFGGAIYQLWPHRADVWKKKDPPQRIRMWNCASPSGLILGHWKTEQAVCFRYSERPKSWSRSFSFWKAKVCSQI